MRSSTETVTQEQRDKEDCIVGRCPVCTRVVYASVASPAMFDADAKKELADMVLEGYRFERMPAATVRRQQWGCECQD